MVALQPVSVISVDPSALAQGRQLRQRADKFLKLSARRSDNLIGLDTNYYFWLFIRRRIMRHFLIKKAGDCGSRPSQEKPKANVFDVIDLVLSLPAYSAECERGFSAMKLNKTDIRNRLTVTVLTDVMRIKLLSPSISEFEPTNAIHAWNATGHRSRRPYHQTSSSTVGHASDSESQGSNSDDENSA